MYVKKKERKKERKMLNYQKREWMQRRNKRM